jgi:hypothetical protein
MHGGLHVEMASFFVSRIVGGLRVTANASGLSAAIPFLVVIKRISSDGLMIATFKNYCNP